MLDFLALVLINLPDILAAMWQHAGVREALVFLGMFLALVGGIHLIDRRTK